MAAPDLAPAERGDQPLGDADEARRREHDEADEQQAEIEQPVRRPDRQELAKQDEEQRAERGPQKASHSADDHHGDELARERDRKRLGRGEAVIEHRQCPASATTVRTARRRRACSDCRIADEARALLVLADCHQHAAGRRAVKAPEQVADGEADRRDQAVIRPVMFEVDAEHARARHAEPARRR